MNKIGLKIRRYKDGPMDLTDPINPGDWTNKVVDIRATLNLYANSDMSRFATFMSFGETGTYITIARLIGGRGGENVAAWLFIPNTITVDGKQVVTLVNAVKRELLKSQIDKNAISQWFSYEYPETQFAKFLPSKPMGANAPTAKRTYGTAADTPSLEQLVGENRYQPYYAEYAAILLTGADSLPLDQTASASVNDLTKQPLKEYGTLLPPAQGSLPTGTKAYINSRELAMPIMLEKGTVMIKLTRPGYEGCVDSIRLSEKCQQYLPAGLKWRKIIDPKNIRVIDDMGAPVKNAQITINGGRINAPVSVPEEMLSQVHVTVKCNGYGTIDRTADFSRQMPLIRLKRTMRPPIGGGFTKEDVLQAQKDGVRNGLLFGVVGTAIVFALLIATSIYFDWVKFGSSEKEVQNQEQQVSENSTPEKEPQNYDPDKAKARKFLENKNTAASPEGKLDLGSVKLTKKELDESGLKGLFEAMNGYDLETVIQKLSPFKDIPFVNSIVTAAQNCPQKPAGEYNEKNPMDTRITVSLYIEKLVPSENSPITITEDNTKPESDLGKVVKGAKSKKKTKEVKKADMADKTKKGNGTDDSKKSNNSANKGKKHNAE